MAQTLSTIPYASLSDANLDAIKCDDGSSAAYLFNNIGCPFSQRALWTAAEIDAPVRVYEVGLHAEMPASYGEKLNRYRTVPFLLHQGDAIYESSIIAQFLDATYNAGAFHNVAHPKRAAIAQLVHAKFDVGPFFALLRNNDDTKAPVLKAAVHAKLAELETIYKDHAAAFRGDGPYLLGAKLSSAEIHIMPFLYRLTHVLRHYRGFDVTECYPFLHAAYEASVARPAFQRTVREPEFYVHAFAKLASP